MQPQPQRPSPRAVTITQTVASSTNATAEPCRKASTEADATSHCAHAHTSALHAVRSTRLSTAAQQAPQGAAVRNPLALRTPLINGRWRTRLASDSLSSFAAYLIVTIICGYYNLRIFAIGKNRKIKYPQKFPPIYQALWSGVHVCTITNCVMPNHSLLIASAGFSFLPSVL